ncbi:MAG: GNAT family N-acetyltransferase [Firmicutes bacterium]|nr:GNAT family N-acetyltransferase [Bacillota bacterium]
MLNAFPDDETRIPAIEATIRYYGAYDLRYGSAFSLDSDINEACVIVHSDDMKYTFFRHLLSGSYSSSYRHAMKKLNKADRTKRLRLFDELDRLEATIDIPRPHIYLDFLGTKEEYQHQGRGRRLMNKICGFADSVQLPIMLFTNTDEDVVFYQSLGFHIIDIVSSDEFGFTNTYLIRDPR